MGALLLIVFAASCGGDTLRYRVAQSGPNGHYYAVVDGERYLIDTGTSTSVFTRTIAEKRRWTQVPGRTVLLSLKESTKSSVRLKGVTLRVRGATVLLDDAIQVEESDFAGSVETAGIAGIIGMDVLKNFVVTFDGGSLILSRGVPADPPIEAYTRSPIFFQYQDDAFRTGLPYLIVEVNSIPEPLHIDTGNIHGVSSVVARETRSAFGREIGGKPIRATHSWTHFWDHRRSTSWTALMSATSTSPT